MFDLFKRDAEPDRRPWRERLKAGLGLSRERLTRPLSAVFGRRTLSDETLEELFALARTGDAAGRRVPIGDILVPLEHRWHPILAEKGRRLHMLTADESIAHLTAPASLAQILDILVDNATTHGQGTVEVAAETGVGWICIDVTDEGGGISALPEPSSCTSEGGRDSHGLGLSLARSLAEGAGGALVLKRPGPRPVIAVLVP